jgi:hypothetical protein
MKSLTIVRDGKKKPWVHWDDFMEAEFGDMDRELDDDESWMYEIRDAVEMKRGMAIWSKRTPKEITAELKKVTANKGMNIPPNFFRIIVNVFLEKTFSMKEMRKENELHGIEFRKWMIEQRKKLKKDPLPVVKAEASKRWLNLHPASGLKARGVYHRPPEVVMDELRDPLADVHFEVAKDLKDKIRSKSNDDLNNSSKVEASAALNKVMTASMVNWEASAAELPEQMTSNPTPEAALTASKNQFKIDEVDILVATEGDYYVVM